MTRSTSFVALYHGPTEGQAKVVGTSVDPHVVAFVAMRLLQDPRYQKLAGDDPVLEALKNGRREALRLIEIGGNDEI